MVEDLDNGVKWTPKRPRGEVEAYTPKQKSNAQPEEKNDSQYLNHVAGLVERRATSKFVKQFGDAKENTIGDIVKDFSRQNANESQAVRKHIETLKIRASDPFA